MVNNIDFFHRVLLIIMSEESRFQLSDTFYLIKLENYFSVH